jgi:hypothetical protein
MNGVLTLRIASAVLLAASLVIAQDGKSGQPVLPWELLRKQHDKNADGKIAKDEYDRGEDRFRRLDRNEDGVISAADFEGPPVRPDADMKVRGEPLLPPGKRVPPAVGTMAPDFELKTKDGKSKVKLSAFRGKKPVALIFGSFT